MTSRRRNSRKFSKTKSCLFCFNIVDEEKVKEISVTLYKLCCKYLHSSLTQEKTVSTNSKGPRRYPFCAKCQETAEKLVDLTEQIESFNKRISELVLVFSLDILHRRGKVSDAHIDKNKNCPKKLVEFDVSTLLNRDSGHSSISTFDFEDNLSFEREKLLTSEILSTESLVSAGDLGIKENPIQVIIEGAIKCENDQNNWTNENDNLAEMELPSADESSEDSITMTEIEINRIPVLKLQRLQFGVDSNGSEVIKAENERIEKKVPTWVNNKTEDDILPISFTTNLEIEDTEVFIKSEFEMFSGSSGTDFDTTETAEPINILNVHSTHATSSSTELYVGDEIRKSHPGIPHQTDKYFSLNSTDAKMYKCEVCNEVFPKKAYLVSHSRVHENEKHYACNECNERFVYKPSLLIHKRKHAGLVHFKCDICNKEFVNKNFLVRHSMSSHKRTVMPIQQQPAPVPVSKLIANKKTLKPFKCTFATCKKRFKYRAWLARHLQDHSRGKKVIMFKCEQCNYSSDRLYNLKAHENRVHRIPTPATLTVGNKFKCRECDEEFIAEDEAQSHYRETHFALDFSDDCIIKMVET